MDQSHNHAVQQYLQSQTNEPSIAPVDISSL